MDGSISPWIGMIHTFPPALAPSKDPRPSAGWAKREPPQRMQQRTRAGNRYAGPARLSLVRFFSSGKFIVIFYTFL
jgi:hypothetical protein